MKMCLWIGVLIGTVISHYTGRIGSETMMNGIWFSGFPLLVLYGIEKLKAVKSDG